MSSPTSALPRTDSKLSLHPKAVAAITTKGHFLGLNDAIPDSLDSGDSIRPINPEDPFFMEVVMYSATFVLAYAAHKVLPSKAIGVRHGFCLENSPLACGFYVDALDGSINAEEFSLIANKFKEVLAQDIPITPVEHPEALILEKLKDQGSHNSYNLLKSKSVRPHYRCYEMDGFITLRRVPLAPSSRVFEFGDKIQLLKEEHGIVIRLDSMAPVPRSSSIDEAFSRAVNWGNSTHTGSIGQINEKVLNKPEPFILLEESRFDNEVVACATTALQSRPKLKVVLISGPSASGKTTFAHKLALAFRGMGKNPTVMSTDDYYRDTSEPDYPKQPNGLLDHEVVEALRLDTLKQHFQDLMDGRPIEAPIFDFVHQKPAEHGRMLSLGSDGILIMEGIFTLDPKICEGVDQNGIFTIFISPMPFSFLDEQSFITNSNYRLIRRIARDYLHRGRDASASIKRLTSVNRGEYNAILPHIGNANYFFNSAMAHELPILAVMTVPLLQLVNPCDEVYPHAQQLLEVLQHVTCCSDKYLNNASLLCEFIGASVFEEPPHIITSEKRPVLGETSESEVFGMRIVPNPSGPMTVQDALVRTMPTVDVHSIAGAYLNGEAVPLSQAISVMDESDEMYIRPLLLSDRGAGSILRATCAFIMHVAVRKLWPTRRVVFAHGFGAEGSDISKAYLARVYEKVEGDERAKSFVQLTEADAEALENEMRRLINSNAPIRVKTVSHATAVAYFKKSGMFYSTSLLESRNVPSVEVVSCEGEMALDMQPLAPHAGLLSSPDSFAIFCHPEGLALSFGVGHGTPCSPSFPERPTISGAREEILRVADFARHATRIHCVGDMNRAVQERQCGSLADVYHVTDHNRLQELADRVKRDGKVKYIFVAGPSLTGKTTFTSRLLVHLRGAGISTREFGTEHYYKDASTEGFPKKEDGTNDYRDLNALDQDSLKKGLDALANGESVKMSGYDIGKGKKDTKKVKTVRGLPPQDGVIVIEGIFALHPDFLADIPREEKLLIVEHPTSILNVDELRFVSHEVLRQLRRIVRDYLCNRRDARETLSMWDDINASEERNLIPYLDRADVMFNASSPYEIGALRGMLIPLLEGVSPLFPAEYAAARQLRRLLEWFHDVPDMRMPHTDSVKSLMYGMSVAKHD